MKKQLFILPIVALLLTGCMNGGGGKKKKSSTTGGSDSGITSSSGEIPWSGKTNKDFEKAKVSYVEGGVEKPLNRNTLYRNQNAPHLDPVSKESHVMVIPFGFPDLTSVQTQANLDKINKTFFGTEEELKPLGGWQSLASFYNTSSYGRTKFAGKMLPTWCVYDKAHTSFSGGGPTAAEYARDWYKTEYAKENHGALGADAEPLTYFDSDGDGFLDLVWVVYSAPTVDPSTDWWAYVTYTGNKADVSSPTVKTLGWASIDWMAKGFGGYDSHTFIHETGHTFGLDDYYDYNKTWSRMGRVDFMDNNLGDHAMYSKFSLGWTEPLVVNDDALITLHPGTTTGDCFILPSPGYNNTAFDEYIMLELMAPVGLAERDYKNGYESTTGFSQPGIRITHVDARAYSGATGHDVPLTDNPQKGIDVRLDNSYMGRTGIKVDSDYFPREDGTKGCMPQFSIIESNFDKTQNSTTSTSFNASNNSLFRQGARFNLKAGSGWAETFMPSGSNLWNKAKTITGWKDAQTQTYTIDTNITFNYAIKVVSITESAEFGYEAKIEVTKDAY